MTKAKPTVHLVCGNTGAGKSTYAADLSAQYAATVFCTDDWMGTLYAPDFVEGETPFCWVTERVERCRTQMLKMAGRLLGLGHSVVLDMGFGSRADREAVYKWAGENGAHTQLHYLNTPAEIRRARVKNRNNQQGSTFSFTVTDSMFDYVEGLFEAPSGAELQRAVILD